MDPQQAVRDRWILRIEDAIKNGELYEGMQTFKMRFNRLISAPGSNHDLLMSLIQSTVQICLVKQRFESALEASKSVFSLQDHVSRVSAGYPFDSDSLTRDLDLILGLWTSYPHVLEYTHFLQEVLLCLQQHAPLVSGPNALHALWRRCHRELGKGYASQGKRMEAARCFLAALNLDEDHYDNACVDELVRCCVDASTSGCLDCVHPMAKSVSDRAWFMLLHVSLQHFGRDELPGIVNSSGKNLPVNVLEWVREWDKALIAHLIKLIHNDFPNALKAQLRDFSEDSEAISTRYAQHCLELILLSIQHADYRLFLGVCDYYGADVREIALTSLRASCTTGCKIPILSGFQKALVGIARRFSIIIP